MSIRKTPSHQKGIGLIELMVSILIGAFILAGVVQLFSTSLTNNQTSEGFARIQENARYVFNRLGKDAVQAGAGGCFNLNDVLTDGGARVFNILGNDTTGAGKYNFNRFVSGVDSVKKDSLFLRYVTKQRRIRIKRYDQGNDFFIVDDSDPDYTSLSQFQIVYAGDCSNIMVAMITNAPTAGGRIEFKVGVTSTDLLTMGQENVGNMKEAINPISEDPGPKGSIAYLYASDAAVAEYKIGDGEAGICNVVTSPENCALLRNDLPLVEGVEAFDVQYGWQDGGTLTYASASSTATAPVNTQKVDRVKVTITFNPGTDIKTLDGTDTINKTFSRVFTLRNTLPAN